MQLKITNDEYVVLDFINSHSGITVNDESLVKNLIGFNWNDFTNICRYFVPMGYISCNGLRIEGTEKLFELFAENGEEKFDEFWKISPKGNKEKARVAFNKCLKLISYEELKDAYIKYLKTVNEKTYQMHVSTWLNPNDKHWEDAIVDVEIKEENKPGIKSFYGNSTLAIR